ncbi:MAG: hypothetical protein GTN76_11035 [Candidatus Aenigmarchaeota archaeon]|nr:hypothetical protein [Candidatus Aenigmarchaeota archaeon]
MLTVPYDSASMAVATLTSLSDIDSGTITWTIFIAGNPPNYKCSNTFSTIDHKFNDPSYFLSFKISILAASIRALLSLKGFM